MSGRAWVTGLVAVLVLVAAGVTGLGAGDGTENPPPASSADVVVRVVDGDTVILRRAGRARLIGVDTPEVFGEEACFGRQASAFATRVLPPGLEVEIERDAEARDRYGRALVYLRLPDGRSFNELLVTEGFAEPLTIPPNVRYADRIRDLARTARERGVGLWAAATCGGESG